MAKKLRMEGKDVDAALSAALKELGLRRDQAEVTIITKGAKGFLGIGAKPAVVEVRKKHWGTSANLDAQIYMDVPKKKERSQTRGGKRRDDKREDKKDGKKFDRANKRGPRSAARGRDDKKRFVMDEKLEPLTPKVSKEHEPQLSPSLEIQNAIVPEKMQAPMAAAKEMLLKTLDYMGVKHSNENVWWDDRQSRILLTFDCENPAVVIGKDGKTLEAMQYLMTLALSRQFDTNISVMADTQNYWRKTEDKLEAEMNKAIDALKRGLSLYRLRPMASQMRRYIHRALANNQFVETASEGEGKWRKVVVKAKDLAAKAAGAAQHQASELTHAAGEVIEAKAEEIKETVQEKAESVSETVKNIGTAVAHKAAELSNAAAEAVLQAEEKLEATIEKYVAPEENKDNNPGNNQNN